MLSKEISMRKLQLNHNSNYRYQFSLDFLGFKKFIVPSFRNKSKIVWSGEFDTRQGASNAFVNSIAIFHDGQVGVPQNAPHESLRVQYFKLFYFYSEEDCLKRKGIWREKKINLTQTQKLSTVCAYNRSRFFESEDEMTDYCLSKMYSVKMAIFDEMAFNQLEVI